MQGSLKRCLTEAATEVSSNCEVLYGDRPGMPYGGCGSWMTWAFLIQGDMIMPVVRSPRRRKSKLRHGAWQGDSSSGTPSKGGTMWS